MKDGRSYLALSGLIVLTGCVATWGSAYHIDSEDGSKVFIHYDSILISVAEFDHHASEICTRYQKVAMPQSRSDAAILRGGSLMRASYASVPPEENAAEAAIETAKTAATAHLVAVAAGKAGPPPQTIREARNNLADAVGDLTTAEGALSELRSEWMRLQEAWKVGA